MNRSLTWLIDDVPPSIAACESDCRQTRCSNEHFENCQLRIEVAEAISKETETIVNC
jgi:hypothetical protein